MVELLCAGAYDQSSFYAIVLASFHLQWIFYLQCIVVKELYVVRVNYDLRLPS